MAHTLYDKLWEAHVVATDDDGQILLYIDRQLLHEVSSPQAFAALREAGLPVHRPASQVAVADHAVPSNICGWMASGRGSSMSSGPNRASPCPA